MEYIINPIDIAPNGDHNCTVVCSIYSCSCYSVYDPCEKLCESLCTSDCYSPYSVNSPTSFNF